MSGLETSRARSEAEIASSRVLPIPKSAGRTVFAICGTLILLFATFSFTATLRKAATYDETVHLVGGYMHRYFHDYRINPEDPALFGMWAALPYGDSVLAVDLLSPLFIQAATNHDNQWFFSFATLYRDKDNDPDALMRMSRSMFTYVGIALGALLAWWSWKLAGSVAAIGATTLFALDPNFAAHASLVKNDVPLSFLMLALGYSIWQFGKSGELWRLFVVALVCAAAVNVKFSGVLFGPMALLMLLGRAILGGEWRVAWINLRSMRDRLLAVFASVVVITLIVWGATWAVYGFRYAPLRDGTTFNSKYWWDQARAKELQADIEKRNPQNPRLPTIDEYNAHPNAGMIARFDMMLEHAHLLPQGWTFGFLFTYATTQVRSTYLLGESSRLTGWWYYFPLAMLFKTPLATLSAMFVALILAAIHFAMPKLNSPDQSPARLDRWSLICVLVPPLLYGFTVMTSNLNLGIRHVLPVYPYIFIGIALTAARLIRLHSQWTKIACAAVVIGLAAESLPAYPNYLPFFNVAAGGSRGGIRLLGDSNIDWGQDLMLLGDWYKTHNDRPLLLSYFGIADPAYYGISYINLPGGNPVPSIVTIGTPREFRLIDQTTTSYVAISAMNLQGVYFDINKVPEYLDLRKAQPLTVLGGSIYIYEWPLVKLVTEAKPSK